MHRAAFYSWRTSCSLFLFTGSLLGLFLTAADAIEQRSFTDDLQRTVSVPTVPARVISLAPSVTEMLFAIGLDREIVAVTPFCDYPPAARQRPKVGYANPSLETIVSLDPDLVIAPVEFLRSDLLTKLEQLNIPTLVLGARSLDDIEKHLRLFGRLFDRSTQAEAVIQTMRGRMETAAARAKRSPPVRVLYVLNSQPLITVGPGSYIHDLIERAGAVNIAASASVAYPRIGMDTVLKGDPEILLFPVGNTETVPAADREAWKRWTDITAVRAGRLHIIPSDVINRPGPRIVDALDALVAIFHPSPERPPATP
ncbi:MAG TPA: cobalamin-binding protein [Nitrospiraceae bacterium]|nr:cobalamin-binding protein [Nitrospiraceae bacterium]